MGIRRADHVTPFYPQNLALTSLTGGGRSVGIVRSRTKATEFIMILCISLSLPFVSSDVPCYISLIGVTHGRSITFFIPRMCFNCYANF